MEATDDGYDEALLRIHLSNMPLGDYHVREDRPTTLFRSGKPVLFLTKFESCQDSPLGAEGALSALVHLLNAREQTEITNGTAPR
jgi:hypothetical protein